LLLGWPLICSTGSVLYLFENAAGQEDELNREEVTTTIGDHIVSILLVADKF